MLKKILLPESRNNYFHDQELHTNPQLCNALNPNNRLFPTLLPFMSNIVKKTRQTKTRVSLGFKSRGKKKMEKEYLGRDGQGSLGAYILLLIPKYG